MGIDYSIALFLYHVGGTFSILVYFFAETFPYIVAVGAIYIALRLYRVRPNLSLALVTSVIVARFLAVPLIRIFIERPRPFVGSEVFSPLFEPSGFSFPSGHATVFFAIAVVMYVWNKKIGSLFIVSAVLVSLARVFAGVHYPLDIIGGAILGGAVGFIVTKFVSLKTQK